MVNTARPPRPRPPSVTELHRAWLDLVDTDGPFLAIPPLKRVWPQGMPSLSREAKDTLSAARKPFEQAWEALDQAPEDDSARAHYDQATLEWVQIVLRDVVGWQERLLWGQDASTGISSSSPDRRVTVVPTAALRGPDGPGALVTLVPPTENLHATGTDGWATTAIDRMEALLRDGGVQIGIVTDGHWWALVSAQPDIMPASGIVDALDWAGETRTRDAFLTILQRRYLIGGDPNERLPKLFAESVAAAEEITEALGSQVRRAVELLVQAFSEADTEHRRQGLASHLPDDEHTVYQACVTAMMPKFRWRNIFWQTLLPVERLRKFSPSSGRSINWPDGCTLTGASWRQPRSR
jgi:hypothetical protein